MQGSREHCLFHSRPSQVPGTCVQLHIFSENLIWQQYIQRNAFSRWGFQLSRTPSTQHSTPKYSILLYYFSQLGLQSKIQPMLNSRISFRGLKPTSSFSKTLRDLRVRCSFSSWNFSFPSEDGHLNSCSVHRYHWTNVSCFIEPSLWVFIYTHEQIIFQPYQFYS